MGFDHSASIIARQSLQEGDQVLLLAFGKRDGLELPVTIRVLFSTLNIKANDIFERGSATIVKIRCGQFNVSK